MSPAQTESNALKNNKAAPTAIRHYTISVDIKKDLEEYNPTLKSILKVEELFQKHGEFGSRSQLLRELGGSMKMQVLNVILKYLKSLGKVLDNEDGSWTWIFAKDNKKMKRSWDVAIDL